MNPKEIKETQQTTTQCLNKTPISIDSFELWYVYFDSQFLKKKLRPPRILLKQYKIQQAMKLGWPKCNKIPQLQLCYSKIENFLTDQKNWVASHCKLENLKAIQSELNSILIILQIEKLYAYEYWESYPRRIQASITHLFILIQKIFQSFLTDQNNTLKQLENELSLCTCLKFLENLNNFILGIIKSLYKFMSQKQFKQQKILTKKFFKSINQMVINLPNLKRSQILIDTKLLEYIRIINPIQIAKGKVKEIKIRPKASTVGSILQRQTQSGDIIRDGNNSFEHLNGDLYLLKLRSKSFAGNLQRREVKYDHQETPKFFYFLSKLTRKSQKSLSWKINIEEYRQRTKNKTFIFGNKHITSPRNRIHTQNNNNRKRKYSFKQMLIQRQRINSIVSQETQIERKRSNSIIDAIFYQSNYKIMRKKTIQLLTGSSKSPLKQQSNTNQILKEIIQQK